MSFVQHRRNHETGAPEKLRVDIECGRFSWKFKSEWADHGGSFSGMMKELGVKVRQKSVADEQGLSGGCRNLLPKYTRILVLKIMRTVEWGNKGRFWGEI